MPKYLNRYQNRINPNLPPQRVLSLFTGMGGELAALDEQGYPIEAITFSDINEPSQRFIKHLYPEAKLVGEGTNTQGDIRHVTEQIVKDLKPTFVNNSFPCQQLSRAGKHKGVMTRDQINDKASLSSSDLLWIAGDILKDVKKHSPDAKVMTENVANAKHFQEHDPRYIEGYESTHDWITDFLSEIMGEKYDAWSFDPTTLVETSITRPRTFWLRAGTLADYFKRKKDQPKGTKKPDNFTNYSRKNSLRAMLNIFNRSEKELEDFDVYNYEDLYADITDKALREYAEKNHLIMPYKKRLSTITKSDESRYKMDGSPAALDSRIALNNSGLWTVQQDPTGKWQFIKRDFDKTNNLRAQGENVIGPRIWNAALGSLHYPSNTILMTEGKRYNIDTPSLKALTILSGFDPKTFDSALKSGIINNQNLLGFLGNGYNANAIKAIVNVLFGQGLTIFNKEGKPIDLSDYRCKTRIKNIYNKWIDKEYRI